MKRSTVSLCMIARDEEATIGMTIKSVLALVDEVIVVDTGSMDNTRIIAEGYGARVLDVAWADDFSAARNAAIAEASCDWIIVLDADEILQPVRPVDFQRLLANRSALAFRVRIVSPSSTDLLNEANRLRIFRNHPQITYQYPIHEQISASVQAISENEGMQILDSDVTLMHDGHVLERRARKRERNLRILQKAIVAYPNEPYFPYRIACDGLFMLDEEVLPVAGIESALLQLHRSWSKVQLMSPGESRLLSWMPDLGAKITAALLAQDRITEAQSVISQVREIFPDHAQVLLQAVAADTNYLQQEGIALSPSIVAETVARGRSDLKKIMNQKTSGKGNLPDRRLKDIYPQRYLGELALVEGNVSLAVDHFEKALNLDPAYAVAWTGMAECSRFAGDRKRALKMYLRSVTENQWNHRAWIRGVDLMREMGFNDNANSWWATVRDMFPEHPTVRANRLSEDAATTGGVPTPELQRS
jgi:tetratricopeptide (TPR) repeat protein